MKTVDILFLSAEALLCIIVAFTVPIYFLIVTRSLRQGDEKPTVTAPRSNSRTWILHVAAGVALIVSSLTRWAEVVAALSTGSKKFETDSPLQTIGAVRQFSSCTFSTLMLLSIAEKLVWWAVMGTRWKRWHNAVSFSVSIFAALSALAAWNWAHTSGYLPTWCALPALSMALNISAILAALLLRYVVLEPLKRLMSARAGVGLASTTLKVTLEEKNTKRVCIIFTFLGIVQCLNLLASIVALASSNDIVQDWAEKLGSVIADCLLLCWMGLFVYWYPPFDFAREELRNEVFRRPQASGAQASNNKPSLDSPLA